MRLFIAEKPSVAKAIVAELGSTTPGDGFFNCKDGSTVTWCFGHLLEQAEPDAYLPDDVPLTKKSAKIWRLEDLPIFPKTWKLLPKGDKGVKKQLATIGKLLKKADLVVHAGDPDREGQLLVDEVLEHFRYKGRVKRFWVSAQDSASIRNGLKSLRDNRVFSAEKTLNLCQSLYEKHKATSYPRTDCSFLPESQHSDAKNVLSAIVRTAPSLKAIVTKCDCSIKSPTWNDNKITAHHGIIPTQQSADWEKLNEDERTIYLLIAERYLANFLPVHEYLACSIDLNIAGERFVAKGRINTSAGWKIIAMSFPDESSSDDDFCQASFKLTPENEPTP